LDSIAEKEPKDQTDEDEDDEAEEEEDMDVGEGDDDDEVDQEKLRTYEMQKLKYYFAVAECDSVATAAALYEQVRTGTYFYHFYHRYYHYCNYAISKYRKQYDSCCGVVSNII